MKHIYRRNKRNQQIEATELLRFKIIITKSGIFWGKRGDFLLNSNGRYWIVEGDVFFDLYGLKH